MMLTEFEEEEKQINEGKETDYKRKIRRKKEMQVHMNVDEHFEHLSQKACNRNELTVPIFLYQLFHHFISFSMCLLVLVKLFDIFSYVISHFCILIY